MTTQKFQTLFEPVRNFFKKACLQMYLSLYYVDLYKQNSVCFEQMSYLMSARSSLGKQSLKRSVKNQT